MASSVLPLKTISLKEPHHIIVCMINGNASVASAPLSSARERSRRLRAQGASLHEKKWNILARQSTHLPHQRLRAHTQFTTQGFAPSGAESPFRLAYIYPGCFLCHDRSDEKIKPPVGGMHTSAVARVYRRRGLIVNVGKGE